VPDRATIGNMSPEFGCTITYFPIDEKTLEYLEKTNRPASVIDLTRRYAQANLLWRENEAKIAYSHVVELDLATIQPSISGPSRPQDKILLRESKHAISDLLEKKYFRRYVQHADRPLSRWAGEGGNVNPSEVAVVQHTDMRTVKVTLNGETFHLSDGDVVISALTSCTNTSNPDVMIGAGLLAANAVKKGLEVKPWVKTSLAPGSKVVTDYLKEAALLPELEKLGFFVVGYGCTSCIGNSGPLPDPIAKAITDNDLIVAAALSSNRNFEARIHPQIKMNFLMSPLLVVAHALAGRMDIDMNNEPLGHDQDGNPVFLRDIWPAEKEIQDLAARVVKKEYFRKNYGEIFEGNEQWKKLEAPRDTSYHWDPHSTYVKEAPFFMDLSDVPPPIEPILDARVLLALGDSITTDHISPAGAFSVHSAAGQYLLSKGVSHDAFNSYGSRRGNDEVMVRGTFANVRIKNKLASKEGGYTTYFPKHEEMTVYEASVRYKAAKTPLLILAGKEYGSGSSRDWAAKGTFLLGVKAVIAESFERIHRSNLVGMGVMPLQFSMDENAEVLGLDGTEVFSIPGLNDSIKPGQDLEITARRADGSSVSFHVQSRLDSLIEIDYFRNGGILQYMLRKFLKA
jgi:aconitate hydratase